MQRYDEFYDRPARYESPARTRRQYRRWQAHRAMEPAPRARYGDDFAFQDDFGEYLPMGATSESQERMGMHDFSERYGRYRGGSPYSYEYSERTIYPRPRYLGPVGFSQPLGEERFESGFEREGRGGGRYGGSRYGGSRYGGSRYGAGRYGAGRYDGARYGGPEYGGPEYGASRYGTSRYGGPGPGGHWGGRYGRSY
jgi:hypothetical protein